MFVFRLRVWLRRALGVEDHTMSTTPPANPAIQDATLLLLVRVNRLLDEADAVRELRDRLVEAARETLVPSVANNAPRRRRCCREHRYDLANPAHCASDRGDAPLSEDSVLGLIRSGELHASNIGRGLLKPKRWRVKASDLELFLDSRRTMDKEKCRPRKRPRNENLIDSFNAQATPQALPAWRSGLWFLGRKHGSRT